MPGASISPACCKENQPDVRIVGRDGRSESVVACPVPDRQVSPIFEKHGENCHSAVDFWSLSDQVSVGWRLRSQCLLTFGLVLTIQKPDRRFVSSSLQEVSIEHDN